MSKSRKSKLVSWVDEEKSSSSSSESTEIDFLGVLTSPHESPEYSSDSFEEVDEIESVESDDDDSDENTNDRSNNDNRNNSDNRPQQDDANDESTSSDPVRPPPRKQTHPKKRIDRVRKDILRLQNSTNLLIPRLPFQRVVREVLQKYGPDLRMQGASIECLRESSEYYLTQLFEDASWACMHRGRVTLGAVDMKLILIIRGETDPGRR